MREKPKPARRRQPLRSWVGVNDKLTIDGHQCRIPGCENTDLERAHLAPRAHDKPHPTTGVLIVDPQNIVWLCRKHHYEFDNGRTDLRPHLTEAEIAAAVKGIGGPGGADRRLSGSVEFRARMRREAVGP